MAPDPSLVVIGGGLAGCEAAWQAASRGVRVSLYEMRPSHPTPAHQTADLAELVCSNSLGSNLADRAPGLLKRELRRLGSLLIACADATAVPAGEALAVGREAFARAVTRAVEQHPNISVIREEVAEIPAEGATVVASGPLTSDRLAEALARLTGAASLYFYDAMAPIVTYESIDQEHAFRATRYGHGDADYVNLPLAREEYDALVAALVSAERRPLRDFEREDQRFFEACLPVEVLAARGPLALAYGPLRPVGLTDPRTGRRPYAVVQLRQDDRAGTLYNLVGFQTNLTWTEQKRVFGLIPGLQKAEWVRFGQMHRNTFLDAPRLLTATTQFRTRPDLFFAGQITGTEGYVGSTASGLVAGLNAARHLLGQGALTFPRTTMLGALLAYISGGELASGSEGPGMASSGFQPMKPNFGLFPPLDPPVRKKRERYAALVAHAERDLEEFLLANAPLDGATFPAIATEDI
ncbi:MAG: methylenetetrahydrofolate--tRNA-(uracil(54)-C(5))-methyltransferase (FADH(2)-oxidizing) TrmFO [Chloroflexi bacterium]|nr:methylenetetrahydrofolate--tRNA-(uracil(54)-C(5))-methyltransferase (FADH(2)-oxidizing) TrmFO [Chloroflexota bacterium]